MKEQLHLRLHRMLNRLIENKAPEWRGIKILQGLQEAHQALFTVVHEYPATQSRQAKCSPEHGITV